MEHLKIIPLTMDWWWGLISAIIFICLGIIAVKKSPNRIRQSLLNTLGIILLVEVVITHIYLLFFQGTWSLQDSLPLHLCRISVIIAGLALISKNQKLYEWSVYLGLPGGLHSILTPELTQGNSGWMMFDYYFTHSMLLFTPIILTFFNERKPQRNAILNAFIYVNLLVIIVFPLNYILNSNYMYLAQKPIAKNPFLIGKWPWYILGLELAGILHMFIMDAVFRVLPKYFTRQKAEQNA